MLRYINITIEDIPFKFKDIFGYCDTGQISINVLNNFDFNNRSIDILYIEHKIKYLIHKYLIDAGIYCSCNNSIGFEDIINQLDYTLEFELAAYTNTITTNYFINPQMYYQFIQEFAEWFIRELRIRMSNITYSNKSLSYEDNYNYNNNLSRYLDKISDSIMYVSENTKGLEPRVYLTYPDIRSPYAYDPNYISCMIVITIDLETM